MPDPLDRRAFLAALASSAAACACASCPLAALAKDSPPAEPGGPVEAGTLDDYPRDGVYDAHAASGGFFVVRSKGRLFALSATCTHKKALLKVKGKAIVCPKHGARFDLDGDVRKAPARRPLPRYAVSLNDAGQIVVDPSRTFGKAQRGDEGSFLRLD